MSIGTARDHTPTQSGSAPHGAPWTGPPHEVRPCPPTAGAVLWAGSERPATWLGVGERAGWLRMRRGEAPPVGAWVRLGVLAAPFADGLAWTAATVREARAVTQREPDDPGSERPPRGAGHTATVDLLVERRVREGLRPSLFERVARRLRRG